MIRLLSLVVVAAAALLGVDAAWAQDMADTAETTATEAKNTFADDLERARGIMLGGAGDSALGRGIMVALFEPVFLAAMFCLGLWAGQMSERVTAIWALPLFTYGGTVVGAFITAFHAEWKPVFDPEQYKILAQMNSTAVVTVMVGLLAGAAVGIQLVLAPFFAIASAIIAGLALGFSQTSDLGEHANAILPFWFGFGFAGLLINIFGIGFETFMQSIKMEFITRWAGFGTLALSFLFGSKIF